MNSPQLTELLAAVERMLRATESFDASPIRKRLRDALESFKDSQPVDRTTAVERQAASIRVCERDGFDWRCSYCVETAQECLNGDRGCPYRQPSPDTTP